MSQVVHFVQMILIENSGANPSWRINMRSIMSGEASMMDAVPLNDQKSAVNHGRLVSECSA